MDEQRQQAFQKLRPVCVELSSVVLKFKAQQASVKAVMHVLLEQQQVLEALGKLELLDDKLAEYAFFPLTHVLKESQRLSPRCMEVAIQSITTLVSDGWRAKLAPAMGQQLLIFMSLLSGGDPRKQIQPPGEELKYAAFMCSKILIRWLAQSPAGKSFFQDQNARNIVDQLVYLLTENITEATSDLVQIAAAETLSELFINMSNRVFLASLLPRTVSSLTKALKPDTRARRTRKVLVTELTLLSTVLNLVLADDVALSADKSRAEVEALDDSWLKATVAQVKNALVEVCKLRTHDQVGVQKALFNLCVTTIENCSKTLNDSIPFLVETSVILTGYLNDQTATMNLKGLLLSRTDLVDILQSSFYSWSQSLPRIMQANDDRPKDLMLTRLTQSFDLLEEVSPHVGGLISTLISTVLRSIAISTEVDGAQPVQAYVGTSDQHMSIIRMKTGQEMKFEPILFKHESQKSSSMKLHLLIYNLRRHASAGWITRGIVDSIQTFALDQRVASIWLAVQLLQPQTGPTLELDDFLDLTEATSDMNTSQAYLIHDLYTQTKDFLLTASPYSATLRSDERLIALALESLTLQAKQLGKAYRAELYETLYPVLALLSSRSSFVQSHTITALNFLAAACAYNSVADLLIANVDYLVNNIAWKLNSFNLSPEAPAVLNTIVTLVGAKVVPYLDDLIDSIFSALNNFHGYTEWVEMLFQVLTTVVNESTKQPQLSIADEKAKPGHKTTTQSVLNVDAIVENLQARKKHNIAASSSDRSPERESAPLRPWALAQDDPSYLPDPTEGKDLETILREAEIADEENDLPAPKDAEEEEDQSKPLSKSHDLLLKIAQATLPHLSSPSPRVRQILLQLLAQISPLLARHENTFLPLVNAVWPGVTQRLLASIDTSSLASEESASEKETAYNITAAAEVTAILCENAGDFMGSRVEQIFGQLKSVYSKKWKEIKSSLARSKQHELPGASTVPRELAGTTINGIVDLHVVKGESEALVFPTGESTASSSALSALSRTSTGQVFTALVRLLVVILGHVRLTEDNADEIFAMLAPLINRPGLTGPLVTDALHRYNPDALWVLQCKRTIEDEIAEGARQADDRVLRDFDMPTLSKALHDRATLLQPVIV